MADPPVVVICGSTRFHAEIAAAVRALTLAGNIVLDPVAFEPAGISLDDGQLARLVELHDAKIRLADWVFVVDPGGYRGESTSREVAYARSLGKPVRYQSEQSGVPT